MIWLEKKQVPVVWVRKVCRLISYPSNLTDTQWQLIETIFEDEMLQRKRVWPLRSIFDAIFYVLKGGIQWRMMPSELPPWQTVYYYYRKWRLNGCWEMLHTCRAADHGYDARLGHRFDSVA